MQDRFCFADHILFLDPVLGRDATPPSFVLTVTAINTRRAGLASSLANLRETLGPSNFEPVCCCPFMPSTPCQPTHSIAALHSAVYPGRCTRRTLPSRKRRRRPGSKVTWNDMIQCKTPPLWVAGRSPRTLAGLPEPLGASWDFTQQKKISLDVRMDC